MKRPAAVLVAVVSAAALAGCTKTLREEMPTTANNPANFPAGTPSPVVVVPVPVPVPTSAPAPQPTPPPSSGNPAPAPTSNPAPKPTSTPNPGTSGTVQVTAGVHSYLHNGRLIPTGGSNFTVGDTLYLNCTPRDGAGNPIGNHGPIQGWWAEGSAKFNITDTNTFNPDLHTKGPGYVDISCQVDGVRAPWKRLTINP